MESIAKLVNAIVDAAKLGLVSSVLPLAIGAIFRERGLEPPVFPVVFGVRLGNRLCR